MLGVRHRNYRSLSMTTTKPRVFIGSSSEAKKVAEAIHRNLDHDCFCEIWTHGIFGVGTYPLEALIEQANKADYAIMVLHPDDVTRSRGKQSQAPRDNVIFELGLFIGKLGKGRTCFVAPRENPRKIPPGGCATLMSLSFMEMSAGCGCKRPWRALPLSGFWARSQLSPAT